MRILLVEDDLALANVIATSLRESEFCVDTAPDGTLGLHRALSENYDLILLDMMLPGMLGRQVLETLRESKATPLLVLTARDAVQDTVDMLNLGADDYLTKPFELAELTARIRALVRRSANHPAPVISIEDISINTSAREVFRNGKLVSLTAKEYAIIHLLISRRGQVVTRTMIYESVYGDQDDSLSNVVDVYIANLRKRLGPQLIETRRGQGYIIRD